MFNVIEPTNHNCWGRVLGGSGVCTLVLVISAHRDILELKNMPTESDALFSHKTEMCTSGLSTEVKAIQLPG